MIYAMSVPPVETIQAVATAPQQTSSQGKTDVHKSTYCVDVDDASTLKEFQGAGTDSPPISAYNAIPALLGPMAELGYERDTTTVHGDFILPPNVQASLKTYVITPPKHGVFKLIDVTHFIYGYYPEPGYLGADSVVYGFDAMAKDGHMMHFVTRVNFAVVQGAGGDPMQCESMKFSYSPGTSASNLAAPVVFSSLTSGEVGVIVGNGMDADITLSQNAAGCGWFTDSNLADTPSDFLPTPNPDVWMAKPDSARTGSGSLLEMGSRTRLGSLPEMVPGTVKPAKPARPPQ